MKTRLGHRDRTRPRVLSQGERQNQLTTNKLKIVVAGDNVTFYLGDKRVGDMNTGLFFKLTPNEILKTIGVSNEHEGWLVS